MVDRPKGMAEAEEDSQTEEAKAAVCQIVVEVGVLRIAEEASVHDMSAKTGRFRAERCRLWDC